MLCYCTIDEHDLWCFMLFCVFFMRLFSPLKFFHFFFVLFIFCFFEVVSFCWRARGRHWLPLPIRERMDLPWIEHGAPRCKRGILPLNYRPIYFIDRPELFKFYSEVLRCCGQSRRFCCLLSWLLCYFYVLYSFCKCWIWEVCKSSHHTPYETYRRWSICRFPYRYLVTT